MTCRWRWVSVFPIRSGIEAHQQDKAGALKGLFEFSSLRARAAPVARTAGRPYDRGVMPATAVAANPRALDRVALAVGCVEGSSCVARLEGWQILLLADGRRVRPARL